MKKWKVNMVYNKIVSTTVYIIYDNKQESVVYDKQYGRNVFFRC